MIYCSFVFCKLQKSIIILPAIAAHVFSVASVWSVTHITMHVHVSRGVSSVRSLQLAKMLLVAHKIARCVCEADCKLPSVRIWAGISYLQHYLLPALPTSSPLCFLCCDSLRAYRRPSSWILLCLFQNLLSVVFTALRVKLTRLSVC